MEREIAEMHVILKGLDKKINGNGKLGMWDMFQRAKGAFYVVTIVFSLLFSYVFTKI